MIQSNGNRYPEKKRKVLKLDEYNTVEKPFMDQLRNQLQWDEVLELPMQQQPSQSYRDSFDEVLLKPKLRKALKEINGFLTETQVDEVVRKLETFTHTSLLENNQQVLKYLLQGTTVAKNEKTGELNPTIHFINYDQPEKNIFTAISQFKLHISGTENYIIPDITLFINGIPIGIVECKSPKVKEPIPEAIDQMMRYSEQRGAEGEGVQRLFYYNQFLIATCRVDARFGTITTHNVKHFYRWTDPYPRKLSDIQTSSSAPNDQQRLVAGMLDKTNLIDLIKTFTIFSTDDKGDTIKIVGRYQQFRAVNVTVKRLLKGKNPDERSGIIWHTQGSGKSLTMMFMVRKMRQYTALSSWKIVFITDRTQLEEQLEETGGSTGFTVHKAEWINPRSESPGKSLKELIANDAPDLIMAIIHKFQERDLTTVFPILNESEKILIMIDEAHRSQYKLLGANLDRSMPHASRIAYTGTPIEKTETTFGDYIDKYTMKRAIKDKVILEIVYEGRTHNAEIPDKKGMDEKFEDVFSDYKLDERLQILGYASRDAYLEAEPTIREKAEDMARHYVENIFTNKFKAQIVSVSREAAVRYKKYFDESLQKIIDELEKSNPFAVDIKQLKKVETAVVISGSHNDKPHIKAFTNPQYHKRAIQRFKMSYGSVDKDDSTIDGNVGIIIVNNMLLTGFDAPVEQVLYMDKVVTEHNLLQSIARVNRVGPKDKDVGFVVDYVGIGHHLKKALASYEAKEQQEITESLKNREELLNELKASHKAVWDLLKEFGCTDLEDEDAFFDLFYDEDTRYKYIIAFKRFISAFNQVLPRKEALDFLQDFLNFTAINELASRHFHDDRLSMKGIPEKLRAIADEYLKSKGIQVEVKPISIIDDDFNQNVELRKRDKTKAAEIEHAIRHYIDINLDEDPELFASFSEELERILEEFKGNWRMIKELLEELRKCIKEKEKEHTYGLDRKKQMPIFRMARSEFFQKEELTEDEIALNVDFTQNHFNLIERELHTIGFWKSIPAQNRLRGELQKLMLSPKYIKAIPNVRIKYKELITRLMEWARKNNNRIVS
jgi:type I restriction enzyme R subunit